MLVSITKELADYASRWPIWLSSYVFTAIRDFRCFASSAPFLSCIDRICLFFKGFFAFLLALPALVVCLSTLLFNNLLSVMWGYQKDDQLSKVTDHLFVGSRFGANDEILLESSHIEHIFTIADETLPTPEGYNRTYFELEDIASADLLSHLDSLTKKIHDEITSGKNVLVHCKMGQSRSVAVTIAYLIRYQKMNLDAAYALVQTARPSIRINDGFWSQLQSYSATLT